MFELLTLWAIVGFITALWNIYTQMVLADNWPPSNWKRISWDAVVILMVVCLFAWPLVVVLAMGERKAQRP